MVEQGTTETPGQSDDSPPANIAPGPLLRFLAAEEWGGLALRNETKEFLKSVDLEFMRTREEEILERLPALEPEKRANLLYDLLCLAAKGEFDALKQRLALHKDEARIVEGTELVAAALEPANSESLITFDDTNTVREFAAKGGTLSAWMYFLHESQRDLVDREFNEPARLRGVSGSGKTCVLLHRARKLARRYNQHV
jgi:superfamily I DNA and RNA helicase